MVNCARSLIVQGVAGDIRGHQVGGELNAPEASVERLGERTHQQRLAQAGYALDQDVAACQQRDQHLIDDGALTNQRLGHLGAHGVHRAQRLAAEIRSCGQAGRVAALRISQCEVEVECATAVGLVVDVRS